MTSNKFTDHGILKNFIYRAGDTESFLMPMSAFDWDKKNNTLTLKQGRLINLSVEYRLGGDDYRIGIKGIKRTLFFCCAREIIQRAIDRGDPLEFFEEIDDYGNAPHRWPVVTIKSLTLG